MIWFACPQCGKQHSRPESSIGSLLFCDCGHGITVPWESTIEEPEVVVPLESDAPEPPPLPQMVPVPVKEERIPVVHPAHPDEAIPVVRPAPSYRRERRLGPVVHRDRNYCFNHTDVPSERACDSCTERFCSNCIVTLQGRVLCGPCKNVHVRELDAPPKVSGLALTAAVVGVLISLAGFCLVPLGSYIDVMPLVMFALLVQAGMLGVGALALYRTEKTPHLRGKSLAVTGIIASMVGVLLTIAATMYSYMPWI